jgi:hypothetical protein
MKTIIAAALALWCGATISITAAQAVVIDYGNVDFIGPGENRPDLIAKRYPAGKILLMIECDEAISCDRAVYEGKPIASNPQVDWLKVVVLDVSNTPKTSKPFGDHQSYILGNRCLLTWNSRPQTTASLIEWAQWIKDHNPGLIDCR